MAKHSCPYCKCDECSHDENERIIWQRSLETLKDYPGTFKDAAKVISHVTMPNVRQKGNITYGESFHVDREEIINDDNSYDDDIYDSYFSDPEDEFKSNNIDSGNTSNNRSKSNNKSISSNKSINDVSKGKRANRDDNNAIKESSFNVSQKIKNIHQISDVNRESSEGNSIGLSERQKKQLINICKEHNNRSDGFSVIGGFVLPDGTITIEDNIAADNHRHFCFHNTQGKAIAFWHLHRKSLKMSPKIGDDDKAIAKSTELDCYMIYDDGNGNYLFDYYYPNDGKPNKKPARIYNLSFSCPPIEQQIAMAKEAIARVNQYISEDNEAYRKEVLAVRKEIEAEYEEVQKELRQSVIEMQLADNPDNNQIANVLNAKYRLAASGTQEVINSVFKNQYKKQKA